ncbi:MAG TPA: SDR family NAD(P)-dependent oxidoreductase [Candidatus Deferrimicrobium sp.]|nr:SDR family NAD(P)-dependent oxidoreductase [Candidatus Kapabacteria bacterium]HLP59844.1 SDR family NAD(P)-dependent oxidoreductase [Candidatus Deferrimicrobium sp.]
MKNKPMQDKIAIVTGGAGGIGRVISNRLAKAGAKVIIFGRNIERGDRAVEEITADGGEAEFYRTDLISGEEIERSMNQVLANYNCIDILVNNAGVSGFMGPVVDTPMQEVEDVLKVNLTSIFHLSKLVLPKMIEKRYGRIINISSVAPRVTPPNSATYNMSKAAVNALTKTLSREVASYGITVNAVAPGMVMTERILKSRIPGMAEKSGVSTEEYLQKLTEGTDTHRLTREEDVAELVMFLASKASQNITGEIVNVAGGY